MNGKGIGTEKPYSNGLPVSGSGGAHAASTGGRNPGESWMLMATADPAFWVK